MINRKKYNQFIDAYNKTEHIENELDKADKEAENPNTKYYSHNQFKKICKNILDKN